MIPATRTTNTRLLPIHEDPTSPPPASAAEPSSLPSYNLRGHSPTIMDCSSDLEEVTPLPISLDDPMIVDGPDITQSRDEIVFKHMKALRQQPGVVKYYVHKLQEHGIDPHKHEAWFPATVTYDSSSDVKVRCRLCGPQATYTLLNWQQHLFIKKHINRVAKRTEIEKKVLWEGFQKCDRCTTSTTLEGTKEINHRKDCAYNYAYDEEPPTTDIPAQSSSKMLTPAELEWAKERARLNKWKAAKAVRAAKVVETPPVPSSSSKDALKSIGSTTLIDAYPSPVSPHREARVPRTTTPPEGQARDQPIQNPLLPAAEMSFRHYKPPAPVSPPVPVAETSDKAHTPPATPSPETQMLVQPVSNPPAPAVAQTSFEHTTTTSVPESPTPGSSTYHNTCAPVVPPLDTRTRVQPVSNPSSPSSHASLKRKTPPTPLSLPSTDTGAQHKECVSPITPSPETRARVQSASRPSSLPAQTSLKRNTPPALASSPSISSGAQHNVRTPPTVASPETQARIQPVSSLSPPAQTSLKRKAPPAPLSLSLTDSSGSYSIYAPPIVSSPETQAPVSSLSPPAQASRKRKAPPAPLSLPPTHSSAYRSAHSPNAMPQMCVQHISSLPPSPVTPGFQHQRTSPIPVSPPMVDPSAYQRAYVFMPSPESQAHIQLVTRSNRPPPAIPTGFQHHQTHLIPVSPPTVSNAYHRIVYGPGVPEPPCPQVPLCFQPYLVPRENLPRLRIPLGFRASSGYTSSAPHSQVYVDDSVPMMSRKRGFDDSFHYKVSQ